MVWLRGALFTGALAFLVLTFVNASWIVTAAPGRPRLIANGGITQDYKPGGRNAPCPAREILPPLHAILEDTARSVFTARRMGADYVAIDVVRTADNHLALYPDADLGCRTEATGPVTQMTMAGLARLDAGYGYSADGGKTFPLRGKGRGLIPSLDEILAAGASGRFIYRFPGNDVAAVPLLVDALKRNGHDARTLGEGFVGNAALVAAVNQALPGAWTIDPVQSRTCTNDYRWKGWTSLVPASCQGATMIAALEDSFPKGAITLWGWPNRVQQRIEGVGGHVMAVASEGSGDALGTGLRHARELPQVPASFHGTVLIDNFWTVGPALRPDMDARTNAEAVAAQDRDENTP
ncbi:UNVERIFIED_ORG: glycerophosphoryl diester phosphodiesterase [Sphingomonas sp. R1F5B]